MKLILTNRILGFLNSANETVFLLIWISLKWFLLDRWAIFGHFNRTGKLIVAQFAVEPLPIIDGIILNNQVSTGCVRRKSFQTRCEDPDCIECDGKLMDLTYLWSMYVPPMLARSLMRILPIKTQYKNHETDKYGNISPECVDWDKLERGASKFQLD